MYAHSDTHPRVIYIHNPSRGHKLLPLLSEHRVFSVVSPADLLRQRYNDLRRKTGHNVILVDNFGRWMLLAMLASLLWRAPLVLRLRGEFFREELERARSRPGPQRWLTYIANVVLARLGIWKSRLIVCNSEYLAAAMRPYTRGKPVQIVRNPYTDPVERACEISLPEASLGLLTVTNMNLWSKVQPTLEAIDAWLPPELLEDLDAHWVICGTGRHFSRLQQSIQRRGLEGRIHCIGRVENMPALYEWCDVLVHLTRIDAFPNATMEAMVTSSPVITNTDSCGTREQVFHDKNGKVVYDGGSFEDAIRGYASDDGLRRSHAEYGRRFVESAFSIAEQRRNMQTALSRVHFRDKKSR